jgi:hypothetical protein
VKGHAEADAGRRRAHHRLEVATVYSTLGTRGDVVEMLDGLMQGADRDLVKVWEKCTHLPPQKKK